MDGRVREGGWEGERRGERVREGGWEGERVDGILRGKGG